MTRQRKLIILNRGYNQIYAQQTGFAQTFGPELFPNPNFLNWSGDNPVGLTVTGENPPNVEITQRAPNEAYGAGLGGLGACCWRSSNSNTNPRITASGILTVGDLFEVNLNMTNRVSGNLAFGGLLLSANNFVTPGNIRLSGRASVADFVVQAGTAPTDITAVPISVRKIMLGAPMVTPIHNYLADFFFEPISPSGQEEYYLFYRLPTIADIFVNGFAVCLRRRTGNTNWDLFLNRFVNTTRTTLFSVSNVGANVNGLRIRMLPNDVHEVSTGVNGVFTIRNQATDSMFNTATLLNTWYPSSGIPRELILAA